MKQYNAEIIAVGTELLLGQIANTNAQWLSKELAPLGINVFHHVVVGDNLERVKATFQSALNRSDIIIVTGGLGPTEDDLTREAFQQITNMELEIHEPSLKKIEQFFERYQRIMTPNNRRQARVFKDSQVLENSTGMAPGMIVEWQNTYCIFLPGVPREMKQLAKDKVLPYLKQITGNQEVIKSDVLKFVGIGESTLEYKLKDMIQTQTNPTIAPLAQAEGVTIRLTAKAKNNSEVQYLLDDTRNKILERVGKYYYGMNEDTLEQQIMLKLKNANMTLAAAESLTGGLFMDRMISTPGASNVCLGGVVSYDVSAKEKVLGISRQIIEKNGTVSDACALEMAKRVMNKFGSTVGISFTGIAGPDEIEGKPVGTVHIAICTNKGYHIEQLLFNGDRNEIRRKAVLKGLEKLYDFLSGDK